MPAFLSPYEGPLSPGGHPGPVHKGDWAINVLVSGASRRFRSRRKAPLCRYWPGDYFILQPVSSQGTSTAFAEIIPLGASNACLKYFVFATISVYQ